MYNKDRTPMISVGIPTFNRAETLKRAIESVINQKYPKIEIIISDNASSDNTPIICETFSQKDGRVRYIRQKTNIGPTANFIETLKRSRGELFMWLADDDWLSNGYLESCVNSIRKDNSLVMVSGNVKYMDGKSTIITEKPMEIVQRSPLVRMLYYYANVGGNGILYGVMRRDKALRVNFQNTMGGDWLFVAGMAYQGKIKTIDEAVLYRSIGGISKSFQCIADTLGLKKWTIEFPHISIAISAALDIIYRNQAYIDMTLTKKCIYSYVIFTNIMIKKSYKSSLVRILRYILGDRKYRKLLDYIRNLKNIK